MVSKYPHLTEKTAAVADLSTAERVTYVKEKRWITYDRAKLALKRMQWLIEMPPSPRMPNMLIIGESNNGKSHLLKQFYKKYPADAGRGQFSSLVPVLYFEMPPDPDEGRIYDEILSLLNAPFRHNDRTSKKHDLVIYYLAQVGARMLMIDEFQHLAHATPKKQRACLNAIKLLGTQNQVPIIAAGVKDAMNVISSDPQLANRFEPFLLPKWTMADDYRALLASFEMLLPLRQESNLQDDKLAQKILSLSEGLIGEMAMLLSRATELALVDGQEHLRIHHIENAVWATPSERKRVLERWH